MLTLLLISSCEDSIEVTTTTNINESASVTILETNGTAINFNEVIEGDLNQLVSNFNSINDITIDSIKNHPTINKRPPKGVTNQILFTEIPAI